MRVVGLSWMTAQTCGSLRRDLHLKFEDPKLLYASLKAEGFFSVPLSKVRWFHTVSERYCLASALALKDAFESATEFRAHASEVGVLSLSCEGALQSNLEYFKDYIQSGRKLARGNLFIHTLPTSRLAEVAIAFGLKGPSFHLSAADPSLNLLFTRCAALVQAAPELNLLCYVANEQAILCFYLKPDQIGDAGGVLFSWQEMTERIGNLWDLKAVFQALKIETELIQQ